MPVKIGHSYINYTFSRKETGNSGSLPDVFIRIPSTWQRNDGIPMVDYSSQEPGGKRGIHAHTLNEHHFQQFLQESREFDFDVMLQIKEKERVACRALELARGDARMEK